MVRLIDSDNPQTYDTYRKEYSSFHKKKYNRVFSFIKKDKNFKVLEVGAATGIYTKFLVQDFSNTIATDLRKEMIDKLKQKRIKAKATVADSLKLPFKKENFDLFVGISILHHIPREKRKKFFMEANRVLKKGGFLVLTDPNKFNPLTSFYQFVQGENAISRFEFKKFSKQTGFKVEKIGEILLGSPGISEFLDKIPFWWIVEKFLETIGLGVTVFLIARKK